MARPRGSKKERATQVRIANGKGKLIGYVRVSTQDQGKRGHSLDGQRARLCRRAAAEGFEVIDIIAEVASGAKERDGLAEVQRRIMEGEAQGIVFPKVDRVGRSQIHLLHFVKWAEENRVDLLSADEGWQVRDGKRVDRMLPFRLAMAEVELDRIRERTREGLQAAKAKGVQLGRPAENTGPAAARAVELRREGLPLAEVVQVLNREGFRTRRGKLFGLSTVYRMINREDPAANPIGGYQGKVLAAAA